MRKIQKISIVFMILFVFFMPFIFIGPQSSADNLHEQSIEDFLNFEQRIIDLNNSALNEEKNISGKNKLSQDDNEDIDEGNDLFELKRLIISGDVKNTFGAIENISYNGTTILIYSSKKDTEYAYNELKKDKDLIVCVDKVVKFSGYCETDYDYSSYQNWGIGSIDVGGYWKYLNDYDVNKEVVVVVIDTGINTSHEMFADRLIYDSDNKIRGFSYFNSKYQYSYSNLAFDSNDLNKYSFEDDHKHGSHVAGIVCSLTPQNVKILPIKISNNKGESTESIIEAAYLRILNIYSNEFNVVCANLSFSGGGKSSEEDKEYFNSKCYQPLLDKNILAVTAAGNEGEENNVEGLKAIVVSSLKKGNSGPAIFDDSYSNYGNIIDISAPGTAIVSAGVGATDESASSKYITLSGTSMASPQVAGVIALLYLDPNLSADFTANDMEEKLYSLAMDLGEKGKDEYYGNGALNLKYFQVAQTQEISFYKNNELLTDVESYEPFDTAFELIVDCGDSDFEYFYTLDGSVPTYSNSLYYQASILVDDTIYITAIGFKIVSGEIVERTDIYSVSFFSNLAPLENYLDINSSGQICNYTGNYSFLRIPQVFNNITVTSVAVNTFENTNLKTIYLPDTLTTICGESFLNCNRLVNVYAPCVEKIFKQAFDSCDSIKNVTDSFEDFSANGGLYFPKLKETNEGTFKNCESLENVSLSNFETMGSAGSDFENCINLKSVYLPKLKNVAKKAFYNCENLNIDFYVGKDVETIANSAFTFAPIKSFILDEGNGKFYSDKVAIYSKTQLVAFASGNEGIDYEVLTSVRIGGQNYDVNMLGEQAFVNARLHSLTIHEDITYIMAHCADEAIIDTLYYNAKNILPAGYWTDGSTVIYRPFGRIGKLVFKESVETVPENLFYGQDIEQIVVKSASITFGEDSLRYDTDSPVIESLTLDFDEQITTSFLSNLFIDGGLEYRTINSLYTKSDINSIKSNYSCLNNLTYIFNDGNDYVYTTYPLYNNYKITASSNINGTINPDGISFYERGGNATFTFTASKGFHVSGVVVDDIELSNNELVDAIENGYTFENITQDHTIEVLFERNYYTVKFYSGETVIDAIDLEGYYYGDEIDLPSEDVWTYGILKGWYDNPELNGQPITKITKYDNGDKVFYGKFENSAIYLKAVAGENGSISPSGYILAENGETKHFDFVANTGYHVSQIIVDGNPLAGTSFLEAIQNGYTFENITENHTISVNFAINTYTITVIQSLHGEIVPAGEVIVEYGDDATFLIIPDAGYLISSIIVDNVSVDLAELSSYTFTNIISDHTISANFVATEVSYTVKHWQQALSSENATLIGEKYYILYETEIKSGVTDTLTQAYERIYFGFTNQEFSQTNISGDGNSVIDVLYLRNSYTLTLSKGQGILSVSGEGTYLYGKPVTISATLCEGYDFECWNEVGQNNFENIQTLSYTFDMPFYSFEMNASAKIKTYALTIIQGENGTITSDKLICDYGQNIVLTFSPASRYHVSHVFIDNMDFGSISSYTLFSVKSNHNVTAYFAVNTYTITLIDEGQGKTTFDKQIANITEGESRIFTFTPEESYIVQNVEIGGLSMGAVGNEFTINNISSDMVIHVIYSQDTRKETNLTVILPLVSLGGTIVVAVSLNAIFSYFRKRKYFK